jgi:hypothetical protein
LFPIFLQSEELCLYRYAVEQQFFDGDAKQNVTISADIEISCHSSNNHSYNILEFLIVEIIFLPYALQLDSSIQPQPLSTAWLSVTLNLKEASSMNQVMRI